MGRHAAVMRSAHIQDLARAIMSLINLVLRARYPVLSRSFCDASRHSRLNIARHYVSTCGVSVHSLARFFSSFAKETLSPSSNQDSGCRPFYLDYQATTPLDPRVLDAMLPFCVDMFGNPHSRSHAYGWEAEHFVEEARRDVANLVGVQPKEVIFTSGATESNNLAVKGVAGFFQKAGKKKHIVTTQIEHKCVLASCRDLQEQKGWEVTYLPVGTDGLVDLNTLKEAIRPETALVSVMMVNNEIGVVQPIAEIGKICKEKGVLFHTDAAQACGKLSISLPELNVDLMSISGHKMYGPKGVGALVVRNRKPRIRLDPIISGGGQERGLRSGTLPAFLVVGLGRACRIASEEIARDEKHISMLEKRLREQVMSKLSHVVLNGSQEHRYKGNLNLSFEAVEGESLLMSLKNVALSSGSACTSASLEPSYVLRAIGVGEDLAHTSLRFGFGRFTTIEEVDACAQAVVENVTRLRTMSPLWEFVMDHSESTVRPVWT